MSDKKDDILWFVLLAGPFYFSPGSLVKAMGPFFPFEQEAYLRMLHQLLSFL